MDENTWRIAMSGVDKLIRQAKAELALNRSAAVLDCINNALQTIEGVRALLDAESKEEPKQVFYYDGSGRLRKL